MSDRWVTVDRAAEITGLPVSYFHERTGKSGRWPEGEVWKWFDGRKLVDMNALYRHIDARPSIASKRGQRQGAAT